MAPLMYAEPEAPGRTTPPWAGCALPPTALDRPAEPSEHAGDAEQVIDLTMEPSVEGEVSSATAVVRVSGRVGSSCLSECWSTVDRLLRHRPSRVVLDLADAVPDPVSASVVEMLRRYVVGHGATLQVVNLTDLFAYQLEATGLLDRIEHDRELHPAPGAGVGARLTMGRSRPSVER